MSDTISRNNLWKITYVKKTRKASIQKQMLKFHVSANNFKIKVEIKKKIKVEMSRAFREEKPIQGSWVGKPRDHTAVDLLLNSTYSRKQWHKAEKRWEQHTTEGRHWWDEKMLNLESSTL